MFKIVPALTETEKDAPVFNGSVIVNIDKNSAFKFCGFTGIFVGEILYRGFPSSNESGMPSGQCTKGKKYP